MQLLQIDNETELGFTPHKVNTFCERLTLMQKNDRRF
tara:strand:- start:367 stop:477 length:111 start_codon:yes stop_codon:yes gene_type:complete